MLYDNLSVRLKIIILEDGIEIHIEDFVIGVQVKGCHLLNINIFTFVKRLGDH